jgi:hypothetical protein
MKVLKWFKTVNQVFNVGDELYDDIENLSDWVSRDFVAAETFINGVATPVPVVKPEVTEVPVATFA